MDKTMVFQFIDSFIIILEKLLKPYRINRRQIVATLKNVSGTLDEFSEDVQRIWNTWELTAKVSYADVPKDLLHKYGAIDVILVLELVNLLLPVVNYESDYEIENRKQRKKSPAEGLKINSYADLSAGDLVVHETHGIGRFAGIVKMKVDGFEKDYVKICYAGTDTLYVPATQLDMVAKYLGAGEDKPVKLSKMGGADWTRTRSRAKAAVKDLAKGLIQLYAERARIPGYAFSPDTPWQREFEENFGYTETDDQLKCIAEIKADMESSVPMDRLLCGDVGYGKTEVALRAVMKCIMDGKQAAMLVPTTVLAQQHYQTAVQRFFGFPVEIRVLSRFRTSAQISATLKDMQSGKCDLVIGTHRLLQKDVKFKDLGLLVVDEEQRFGVSHKEHIKEMSRGVDVLSLSATPIPRTLNMALSGIRDMSGIEEPPQDRLPVQTFVMEHDWGVICDAIGREIQRGGQVYYMHNHVESIDECAAKLQKRIPEARIAIGHGQMEGEELEHIMTDFINHQYDVLISTTIVESGLDIVNANTMIINDAQNFALNVLHQLRGRVGRSNQKAFCYLFTKPFEVLNDQARKRLQAIEDYSDIGSGIQIALRDLDIRGAGNILGADQSGFINEIGYEMYQKILAEAIQEMRDTDFDEVEMADNSGLLTRECVFETDIEALFPSDYVASVSERMSLYKELEAVKDLDQLEKFRQKVVDIFGPMPKATQELMQTMPLRMLAGQLHFEKIILKKNTFTGYFIGNSSSKYFQSDAFGSVLAFLQANHPAVQLKELNSKLLLIIHNTPTIKSAMHWLEKMEHFCLK